jgi:hypothetical protein
MVMCRGKLKLSDPEDSLFRTAKVGLGALGVVSELTLKCIPQHRLLEHTYTTTAKQVGRLIQSIGHKWPTCSLPKGVLSGSGGVDCSARTVMYLQTSP